MANWRRERSSGRVHLLPEAAEIALCDFDRAMLGATVWEADTAAPDICGGCAAKLLVVTADVIARTSQVLEERGRVPTEQYEATYRHARQAMRELARVVPAGVTADRVVYARACLARNDPRDADASLRLWRDQMREIGLLPTT